MQQGIESDHFQVKKNMPGIGGFQSFHTARCTIQGFEAMLWLRKGFGFAGRGPSASRTDCWPSASDVWRLTKPEPCPAHPRPVTCSKICHRPS